MPSQKLAVFLPHCTQCLFRVDLVPVANGVTSDTNVGCAAPLGRDEGCAAPSEAKAGCAALLGPPCRRRRPCCGRRAIGSSTLRKTESLIYEPKLLPCDGSNIPPCFVLLGFVLLCCALLFLALLCFDLFLLPPTNDTRMLRAMRRLCTGYAALHTSDDAAENEDSAAEPSCAALA